MKILPFLVAMAFSSLAVAQVSIGPGPYNPGFGPGNPVSPPNVNSFGAATELCFDGANCRGITYFTVDNIVFAVSSLSDFYVVSGSSTPCPTYDFSKCPFIYKEAYNSLLVNATIVNAARK